MKYLILMSVFLTSLSAVAANNFHLLDSAPNGFAVYRASTPDAKDMRIFCELGITEMMVLSGTADEAEYRFQSACPSLKVVYNQKQRSNIPLDRTFLNSFDNWVRSSQAAGKKIAFRCECGCHRTGRLAAYYELKFKDASLKVALENMNRFGKYMFLFPGLVPQVKSLDDYIADRECSTQQQYCVQN